jgi:hypothetical protein
MESMLKGIFNRIYADYLMPSRLGEYQRLLQTALDAGYRHLTLSEYFKEVLEGKDTGKCFLHRHDIDTDVSTARKMFEIENKLGVKTSFYFRLNTLDYALMQEIHVYGSEVGYHYEELAQYCKNKRIMDPIEVEKHFDEIQELFYLNFSRIQDLCAFKINTIASHGDFVNRKLGIANHAFITQSLLDKCNIDFECYDARLINSIDVLFSDTHYPRYYLPSNPFDAMKTNHKVIYLLSHTRHWRTAPLENTMDNLKRLWEGINYR